MRKSPVVLAGFLVLAFGCGGQVADALRRPDGSPVVASLATGQGPGTAELRAGRPEAARARFEAVLARDPEQLPALNDLAVSYALEDRLDAARSLLDEVVAHGSPRAQQIALLNLGELYALEGYLGAAQAHLEAARSVDPERAEPLYALALLADVRGDRERARELARAALSRDEGGAARGALVALHAEERIHLEALVAEARGEIEGALPRWRELRGGRFPSLAAAAQRRLDEER
jgi:tetratricopeptide (TPR) repeat protein